MPGDEIGMIPWMAELMGGRFNDGPVRHDRALAMRLRRIDQDRLSYEDTIDIVRHYVELGDADAAASFAGQVCGVLQGTVARLAYLSESRPLIPTSERAWAVIAHEEISALLAIGDLKALSNSLAPSTT